MTLELRLCKRTDPYYQHIRDRHYVENHGTIGRQIHYKILRENEMVGIITGASAVWACKPRDDFFGITSGNRENVISKIICNTVFRLEDNRPNLGSQILAIFRRRVVFDWMRLYDETPIGFETFIFGEGRFGSLYKADNWTYCGLTSGSAKCKPHGAYNPGERRETEIKMVFCKRVAKEVKAAQRLLDFSYPRLFSTPSNAR